VRSETARSATCVSSKAPSKDKKSRNAKDAKGNCKDAKEPIVRPEREPCSFAPVLLPSRPDHCFFLLSGARHPPHDVAHVVGDEQRAAAVDRDADRAAERIALSVDESSQDVDRLA
jgi:hypothetical protein